MMYRFPLFLTLFLLAALPVSAQLAAAPDVPVVSFSQQVEIVVAAKKDPRILDIQFHQDKDQIIMALVVDKSTELDQGKKIALNLVIYAKAKSLDDQPKSAEKPGKGLYTYHVTLKKPDGVVLVSAIKEKTAEDLVFEDPFLIEPLNRADAASR